MVHAAGVMLSVPLLFHVRPVPSVPPVTVDVEPSGVVRVEAAVAAMVPADQVNAPVMVIAPLPVNVLATLLIVAEFMVIAPLPVKVPPLIVVVPLKIDAPATVKAPPAEIVKLASHVSVPAFCPAVVTNTVPAPEPMKIPKLRTLIAPANFSRGK